jgi:hypothetical protein
MEARIVPARSGVFRLGASAEAAAVGVFWVSGVPVAVEEGVAVGTVDAAGVGERGVWESLR